ncbi:MAG: TolC family protein [Planctomycetota bacterium]
MTTPTTTPATITMTTKPAIAGCLWLALTLLPGCAASDPFERWDDQALASRVERLSTSSGTVIGVDHEPASIAATLETPKDAGPDWFVDQALLHNAEVLAAKQRVERLRERVPQAMGLPDPMVTFTFGELAETAAGQVDYIVGVQQRLPAPGTLDARGEVARQEVVEALHDLQATLDKVRGDTARAYWAYYEATREAEVLKQNRVLLSQIEAAVGSRVRVNQADQSDLLRISRRVASLDNQLAVLEQRQRTAAAMLARLTSRRVAEMPAELPTADWTAEQVDRDQLIQRSMQTNPQVQAAQARVATYRQKHRLAKKGRQPDFMVGVQYGAVSDSGLAPSANGEDQIAGTVGVSIPLWTGQYDAAEREALRGMGQSLAEVRAAQDRVAFEIEEALARIDAAEQSLKRLRERMMPDAQQTIDIALVGYRNGDVDFLQLLDDWQALLDDQLQETRLISELHRLEADLQQAMGSEQPEGGRDVE